jgi:hypothetical protein
MEEEADRVVPLLGRNRAVWTGELARLRVRANGQSPMIDYHIKIKIKIKADQGMSSRDLFVYVIVGDHQVSRLNYSLAFLKQCTPCEIIVIAGRCNAAIEHDQILRPPVPDYYDDHQGSILLKTNIHRVLGCPDRSCCYLDSDLIAVRPRVEAIFSHKHGPVTFAPDHTRLREFSRFAVQCSCVRGECGHLRQRIQEKFGVHVADANWQHWNGGVFLFDGESTDFLDTWHEYTRAIFHDPLWKTRDQGTLVAAAWRYGLQDQATLDRNFNRIVDPMRDLPISDGERAGLRPPSFHVDASYSLAGGSDLPHPWFLHLINGSVGAAGWKNWDDAAALLKRMQQAPEARVSR